MIEILKIALFVLCGFAMCIFAISPVIIAIQSERRNYHNNEWDSSYWIAWFLLITVPLAIGFGVYALDNLTDWFFT